MADLVDQAEAGQTDKKEQKVSAHLKNKPQKLDVSPAVHEEPVVGTPE